MSDTTQREQRFALAERVLEEYFTHRGDGVDRADFEQVVLKHPELVAELRKLYAACGEVDQGLLQGRQSFAAQQAQVQATLEELRSTNEPARRYAVEGELGKGGMGAVFRVVDRALDRPLAMKVILGATDAARSGKTPPIPPHRLKRFLNEAKITSQLDHPGIVPVHEVGVDAEGRAYFTMKLVQGRTLAEIFRLQLAGDPEWTRPRILTLIQRVCEAVAFAHERGVIHRDLKPANVMVGDFGEVYVMDWGLARRLGDVEPAEAPMTPPEPDPLEDELARTREGAVVGTPAYMPPEQAAGAITQMGPQSDVYAIGAMLYELIAGNAPYCEPGKNTSVTSVLLRIGQGPPQPLPRKQAPPELVAICERAMAGKMEARFPDVRELGADLGAFLDQRVVKAYHTGALAELRKWVERNRTLALAIGVSAVALALTITLYSVSLATKNSALISKTTEAENNATEARMQAQVAKANEQCATEEKRRADSEAEIAKKNEQDVLRLSALQRLDDLISEADRLWPAYTENNSKYKDWLKRAYLLVAELPEHEKTLTLLSKQALPITQEQVATSALESHYYERFADASRELAYKKALLTAFENGQALEERLELDWSTLPDDPKSLQGLAWSYVDPTRFRFGHESEGLAIAQRVLALSKQYQPEDRAIGRHTLAWALLATGRFDEAIAQEEQALQEGGPRWQTRLTTYLQWMRNEIDGWMTPQALMEKSAAIGRLTLEVAQLRSAVEPPAALLFQSDQDRWWHSQLSALVKGIRELENPATGPIAGLSPRFGWSIQKRLEFSASVQSLSVSGHSAAQRWVEAIESIANVAECSMYAGLRIGPQLGLIPIGRDPDSGLWEFAHLQTGEPAERTSNGTQAIDQDTGLVFVLLPGGKFIMGAQRQHPTDLNYDPDAVDNESPPHEVALAPFFISKYEVTQGQWMRFTGKNPSFRYKESYVPYHNAVNAAWTSLLPVEQVTWAECAEISRRLGLSLPTEAQWEYAARAGTNSAWSTGKDKSALQGAGNLADKFSYEHGAGNWPVGHEMWLNDGNTVEAVVGSYKPNGYGLHDTIGNVWEWCLDGYIERYYSESSVQNPCADQEGHFGRVLRGGSFTDNAVNARSARRQATPGGALDYIGFRPVRRVDP